MSLATRLALAGLVLTVAGAAGCNPSTRIQNRLALLSEPTQTVLRESLWAHGDPYTWGEQRNMLIEAHWSDFRHGQRSVINHKIYTIDLTSRRMRIDDLTTGTVSLCDGSRWRVFIQGVEIHKPSEFSKETQAQFAMLEYAASEMRIVRLLAGLPFTLLDDGVKLESLDRVESSAGGNVWDVIRATFDYNTTGFLVTDRILVYFDPTSDRVVRVFLRMSGEPFYSMPFWGEWADYQRFANGMLVPRRWEFRRTDEQGAADKGRRLSIVLSKTAFNVSLPDGIYSSPKVMPPPVPDETAKPKRIGRDPIDVQP
jgi:hypothetical protein